MQAGMDEHDRAARVEQLEERIKFAVTQEFVAIAREQGNAIELEHIERIRDLVAGAIDPMHRDGSKRAEAGGPPRHELGRIFVATARESLRARLCLEADAGLREGGQDNFDVVRVHDCKRELRRPIRIPPDCRTAAGGIDRLAVEWRNVMEVNVNASWRSHAMPQWQQELR